MSNYDFDSSNDNSSFIHGLPEVMTLCDFPFLFRNPPQVGKLGENKERIFEINKVYEKEEIKHGRKRKRNSTNLFIKEGECLSNYEDDNNIHRTHTKYEDDNILRKIQISFIDYLINLANELLEYYGFKEKFLRINHKFKKNVNKKDFNKIKTMEIGEILCQSISPKYSKIFDRDKDGKNKRIYEKVIQNETIKKFLSETYIRIFRDYYLKNDKVLNEFNLNINLYQNIKTFDDFLNQKVAQNERYKKRINEVIKKYYLPKKLFTHN